MLADYELALMFEKKEDFKSALKSYQVAYQKQEIGVLTKKMMLENQLELQHSTNPEEQMLILQTHQHLKQMEIQLTQKLGTVIYK